MKKVTLIAALLLMYWGAWAQRAQSEYLEAKRLFQQGNYASAKIAFASIAADPVFGDYATFYFGLSSYKAGELKSASDTWKQLLLKSPKWDQKNELLFWLTYASFESGHFDDALAYAGEFSKAAKSTSTEELLINQFITPLEFTQVESLSKNFAENKFIARIYLQKLGELPYAERDYTTINNLVEKWGLDATEYSKGMDLPEIKKSQYDIAVLMPFMFESLSNTTLISQNSLIMDMYQGMLLAAEDLKKSGKPVNLLPYDTQKKREVTEKIVNQKGFENVDLIVGPFYPDPFDVVSRYSAEHQINMFNPISSNSEVVGENPFSFLLKPSYETMARSMAEFAAAENENKNVRIYYEDDPKDSLFAAVYKSVIEEAGFDVSRFQVISKGNAKLFLDTLSEQYDYYISKEMADSLRQIPGRYVRDRRLRNDELEQLKKNKLGIPVSYDENQTPVAYYEKRFRVKRGTIGHIMLATRNNLLANNLISAVETRGDNIKLYGYGEWLDFAMISFSQLDRLGVALCDPEYMDRHSEVFVELESRLMEKYHTKPSVNHYRGYEMIWYAGRMLHAYGKYFQLGMREGEFESGKVFQGYLYGVANDNQVVPVVRFNEAKLEVVNKEQYEDREK